MATLPAPVTMDKLVSLCKRRGFVFQSSEIYGGFNGVWDHGPLGAELRNNIKRAWWEDYVYKRTDIVGLDLQYSRIQRFGRLQGISRTSRIRWLNAETATTASVPTRST